MPTTISYWGFIIAPCYRSPTTNRKCGSQQGWVTSHHAFPGAEYYPGSNHRPGMEIGWHATKAAAVKEIDDFRRAGQAGQLTEDRCEHYRIYFPNDLAPTPPSDAQAIYQEKLANEARRKAAVDALHDANMKCAEALETVVRLALLSPSSGVLAEARGAIDLRRQASQALLAVAKA